MIRKINIAEIITLESLQSFFIFIASILCFASFSMQVLARSQWMALAPYFILIPLCLFFVTKRIKKITTFSFNSSDYIILFYLLHLFTTAFFIPQEITAFEYARSIFLYGFPIFFYFYFRVSPHYLGVNSLILAIFFFGALSGAFFLYENYLKLILFEVPSFAKWATEYSEMQQGPFINNRGKPGVRGYGLLETHTVSATFISLGFFAALYFIRPAHMIVRSVIYILSIVIIFTLQCYTVFAAFLLTLFIYELPFTYVIYKKISRKKRIQMLATVITSLLFFIFTATFTTKNQEGLKRINHIIDSQKSLIFSQETSHPIVNIFKLHFKAYKDVIMSEPKIFFIGDGYSFNKMHKGSDLGFLETFSTFGLFMWLMITFYIVWTFYKTIKWLFHNIDGHNCYSFRLRLFSLSSLTIIILTDIHYSSWTSKSIMPIVFSLLAILSNANSENTRVFPTKYFHFIKCFK